MNDLGKAQGYLEKVVELEPDNQVVLSELIALYEEADTLDEGLSTLIRLSDNAPESYAPAHAVAKAASPSRTRSAGDQTRVHDESHFSGSIPSAGRA